ncbi:MAG: CDP-diacylglycerol--glycerol-3-phosphate 3-phosphatidyltransferase [Candidatus Bipolaricaulota bacterium]|nr:CDP-diacylglycerol--glycerol-3-phosphate 3-phosphatidyltransferase [Candidatus Bipolaricaulota bacterium]MDW8127134.1 CDP-diacylglycerol--glycerol-3-phosphate 3-phosphatidyltransferase [Candidatus Bipolaricaulota bacterium]
MRWNVPNSLTLARFAAVPLFLVFLFMPGTVFKILALAIFAVAALTDAVDGYLARSLREVTTFGKLADPIADKVLVAAALVSFVEFGELRAIPVIVILAREFLVTGLRIFAIAEGVVVPASSLGKLKTISHVGLVLFILATRYFGIGEWGELAKQGFLYLAVALAVVSGGEYFWRARALFRPRLTP